jgi:hypothetical protein
MTSLEINDPRTREWKIGSHEAIADNGVAARFVLGEQRLSVEGLDLPNTMVVLKKNGEEIASATGAAVLGDAARAVAWLPGGPNRIRRVLEAASTPIEARLTSLSKTTGGQTSCYPYPAQSGSASMTPTARQTPGPGASVW